MLRTCQGGKERKKVPKRYFACNLMMHTCRAEGMRTLPSYSSAKPSAREGGGPTALYKRARSCMRAIPQVTANAGRQASCRIGAGLQISPGSVAKRSRCAPAGTLASFPDAHTRCDAALTLVSFGVCLISQPIQPGGRIFDNSSWWFDGCVFSLLEYVHPWLPGPESR